MQKNGKMPFHIETLFFFSGCFAELDYFSYKTYYRGLKKYNLQIGIFVSLGCDTVQCGRSLLQLQVNLLTIIRVQVVGSSKPQ
jgi:hypothetical protein